MTFAVTATLFGAAGFWADDSLGTLPLFLILGLLVGFAGGFLHLLSVVAPDLLPFGKRKRPRPDDDVSKSDDDPD